MIRDRLEGARDLVWIEFAERNADLFARAPTVLNEYYSDAVLESKEARERFVVPSESGRTRA